MIPFTIPYIPDKAIDAVTEVLRSGWITTGPVTKSFEKKLTQYCGNRTTLCLNSATAGLELILRWFGVGPGDEVIVPAYTYCASANVILHCGATPVLVDSLSREVNADPTLIKKAITARTKVIIPVDLFGFPCDYDEINALVNDPEIRQLFHASHPNQEKLGRILVLSDAAHSLGASYKGKKTGSLTDVTVFSFHAVKNLTTAEGGSIALNLPEPFDNEAEYKRLNILGLHGQSKDALAKTVTGGWRYDVIEAGYKVNMTDIMAAIGTVQLEEYEEMMGIRKRIFDAYTEAFSKHAWAEIPVYRTGDKCTSYHVYNLRIKDISETLRDRIIEAIFAQQVAVNVHFQPLPLLSAYKNAGYRMEDYPVAFGNYAREISLPVFHSMSAGQVDTVISAVVHAVEKVLKDEANL